MHAQRNFGDWQLKGKLGNGGFGEVSHWFNRATGLEVAVKCLKDVVSLSADEQGKLFMRWEQEYKWTRELKDGNHIVPGVLLNGKENGKFIEFLKSHHDHPLPVIILQYCNGGDVRKLLQKAENANGLTQFEVREILRALRCALEHLHVRCRVYHRDLKPDNIVIHSTPDGRKNYKLTDFGLARPAPEKTIQQSVVGTRHYFAPEVVDTAKYNNKIDYWSMGVIAYELCCGVLPFIPHQTLINIITNIRLKPEKCIAISEDPGVSNRFVFHNELPAEQHLSDVWVKKLTYWMRSALDPNYKTRGLFNGVVSDEVQKPVIFSVLDEVIDLKVLTAFATCSYKYLTYSITASMTMLDLIDLIVKDTGMYKESVYFVLPTGHPHKHLTQKTVPIDLFVDEWQDTSGDSKNPVMLYIFNASLQCTYSAPDPPVSQLIKHCIAESYTELQPWVANQLVLDMHFLLSQEQLYLRMFLLGLKEYAMALEDEIIGFRPSIDELITKKNEVYGAVNQFMELVRGGRAYLEILSTNVDAIPGAWENNCLKINTKFKETMTSVDNIITHFNSVLNNLKEAVETRIYHDIITQDIYDVKSFRKKFLQSNHKVQLDDIRNKLEISFSEQRKNFLDNVPLKHLRQNIYTSHCRFAIISKSIISAKQKMQNIQNEIQQLLLQIIKNAANASKPNIGQLNNSIRMLNIGDVSDNLDEFNSLKTKNLIETALKTKDKLETEIMSNSFNY